MMLECDFQGVTKVGEYYLLQKKMNNRKLAFKSKVIIVNDIEADELRFFYDVVFIGNVKVRTLNADSNVTVIGKFDSENTTVKGSLIVKNDIAVKYLNAKNVRVDGGMSTISNATIEESFYSSENAIFESDVNCPLVYCEQAIIISGSAKVDRVVYGEFCDCNCDCNQLLQIGTEYNVRASLGTEIVNCQEELQGLIEEDDWEEILSYLKSISGKTRSNMENYEQYNRMLEYSYMTHLNNLNEYIDIIYIYFNKFFLLKSSGVIEDVYNAFIVDNTEYISLKFKIHSHDEFAECLQKLCKLKDNIDKVIYSFLLDELYSNIGIKYNLVKRKLEVDI